MALDYHIFATKAVLQNGYCSGENLAESLISLRVWIQSSNCSQKAVNSNTSP
ncbi:hypothetical protein T4C_10255 [Trichinella pseudospiralis]|uniref:Uncharacterized protein n=1 Tax=Trichinella pseudospiralis TaxID=6337 RepID=A0A0V1GGZ5_TRIPS|nr:hypothetical protein T4C_10255 [Trichinella pseudospiralis]